MDHSEDARIAAEHATALEEKLASSISNYTTGKIIGIRKAIEELDELYNDPECDEYTLDRVTNRLQYLIQIAKVQRGY